MISNTSSVNIEDFCKLLEGSPNLYCLYIDDGFLSPLLNNKSVCHIVQRRITHLYVTISLSNTHESTVSLITHLASIFPLLKHLYIWMENSSQSDESLIVTVFNYLSVWNALISFVTVGIIIKEEILTKGLRQWVIENSSLHDTNSFIVDYFDERFRLWL
jgi:hypothetical protein